MWDPGILYRFGFSDFWYFIVVSCMSTKKRTWRPFGGCRGKCQSLSHLPMRSLAYWEGWKVKHGQKWKNITTTLMIRGSWWNQCVSEFVWNIDPYILGCNVQYPFQRCWKSEQSIHSCDESQWIFCTSSHFRGNKRGKTTAACLQRLYRTTSN